MKKIYSLACLSGILLSTGTSCKKGTGFFQPGEVVLSKVFRDEILDTEYLYDPDKGSVRITYTSSSKPLPESVVRHRGYPTNFGQGFN